MKSMTGYGLGKSQSANSAIDVSLRAVNGRFLETRWHLPREFVAFEADLKKNLEKHIQRGTVDIFVSRRLKPAAQASQMIVNKDLVRQYEKAFGEIGRVLKSKIPLHLEAIARLPDVITLSETTEVSTVEKKSLFEAFEKACRACDTERRREGKSLKTDLDRLLSALEKLVSEIHSVREEANKNLLERFEQRIQSKLSGVELDSTRLSQEVVIQIEKSDINEELMRLKEHIQNYRQILNANEPQGKKLDFYTQELLREVNTIGSKSSVSKLTQIVVEAKTLIERLREQVQNVE
jgi:uncharacterized protein (TIGR00255 family)